ncbi:ketopantoate reductase family protein [Roseimarinus sediminis]|uniref:ketopantoate reductase family protein n=1 Tax=Roseimarinus sediminis TaxID=1610899 RepID=UPI003D19FCCD
MKILVIGSGAVGSLMAGILTQKGFDVDLACKNSFLAEKINMDGIIFKIRKKRYIQFLPAYESVEATPGNYQYVFLATKTFDIEAPTRDVISKLSPNGLIVSLQDGYCQERLARIAGSNRIVGAMVGIGVTLTPEGLVEMTSRGTMVIGKLDGKDDPRLDDLQYMLNMITPTGVVDNINAHVYSKLIINSCVTTIGAISGLRIGALITDKNMRNLFIKIIDEALQTADALKIEIPEYAGRLDYRRLIRGNSLYHRVRKHLFIRLFGIRYRRVKSSGLQALERGEKTEIDYLNGYIIQKGKEIGLNLPVNERLVQLVHEIENHDRPITPDNLNDPLFRL